MFENWDDDDDDDKLADLPDLGPCHACDRTNADGANVRNILMHPLKCLVPETGWGCVVCNLPSNGASSAVCDDCLSAGNKPKYAFAGYPLEKDRIPIEELTKPFIHNDNLHQRLESLFSDIDIKG
jgi:hypothetical protein